MFGNKNTKDTIDKINIFFDKIDQTLLVFKDGLKNYLHNHIEQFNGNLETMTVLETQVNNLRRQIEYSICYKSISNSMVHSKDINSNVSILTDNIIIDRV